jgi:hypothetical protein
MVDFASIRQDGCYYADKTRLLYQLVREKTPYFLSRPRRFGKTLLVSTLKYILQGRRDLFQGLWIDGSDYDWKAYPVIRLEMNYAADDNVREMNNNLAFMLDEMAAYEKISLKEAKTPKNKFSTLIRLLYTEYGSQKVAILIDEYDAPIIEHINNSTMADKIRRALRRFYGVLKTNNEMIGHIFITGVSRFTKTSIFSGLNNLEDLTLDSKFSTICGLTEANLEDILAERQDPTLAALIKKGVMRAGSTGDDLRQLIKDWYDGYSWDGENRVYNPWSALQFIKKATIDDYWYDSGSPSFLVELIRSKKIIFDYSKDITDFTASRNAIDQINNLKSAPVMFQTGYLTIKECKTVEGAQSIYSLTIPNLEVKASLIPLILSIEPLKNPLMGQRYAAKMCERLFALDAVGLGNAFTDFLSQLTYDALFDAEKYYYGLFELIMMMVDQRYDSQAHTAFGRLDFFISDPEGNDFIIEIKYLMEGKTSDGKRPVPPKEPEKLAQLHSKMVPLAREALDQISQLYVDRFKGGPNRVFKVALVIARRQIVLAQIEEEVSRGIE